MSGLSFAILQWLTDLSQAAGRYLITLEKRFDDGDFIACHTVENVIIGVTKQ